MHGKVKVRLCMVHVSSSFQHVAPVGYNESPAAAVPHVVLRESDTAWWLGSQLPFDELTIVGLESVVDIDKFLYFCLALTWDRKWPVEPSEQLTHANWSSLTASLTPQVYDVLSRWQPSMDLSAFLKNSHKTSAVPPSPVVVQLCGWILGLMVTSPTGVCVNLDPLVILMWWLVHQLLTLQGAAASLLLQFTEETGLLFVSHVVIVTTCGLCQKLSACGIVCLELFMLCNDLKICCRVGFVT